MYGRGTESRDQYKTIFGQRSVQQMAYKRESELGSLMTSSVIALPWPAPKDIASVSWPGSVGPSGVVTPGPPPESTVYGSEPQRPIHQHPLPNRGPPMSRYELPKPAAKVRYLNGPYVTGAMAEGSGIDKRPVSSVSTFQMASDRQKELLVEGHNLLQRRMAENAKWTAERTRKSRPISASPTPYLTTLKASYKERPAADAQQQRVRKLISAPLAYTPAGERLSSAPIHKEVTPLAGGTALHATRYLGVQDPDGTRRLLDMDSTGGPLPIQVPPPRERPRTAPAIPFVASQPSTKTMDEEANVEESLRRDMSATPLPRRPWPTAKPTHPLMLHQRKSFAGDFTSEAPLGEPITREYKILATKEQAAAAKAAWAASF